MSSILPYRNILPKIADSAFIADNAVISGDTVIGDNSGIWYGCVIRGDVAKIRIGSDTNIQDGTIVHVTRANHLQNKTGAAGGPTIIGDGVTIGHQAIIHACTIGDHAFIGMGAVIMDLAVVEEYGMVAAGAILTPGKIVKSGELWGGNPARFMRMLSDKEKEYIAISAQNYAELAAEYKDVQGSRVAN